MNILLLSWRGPGHPNAGGAEISTYEHARRWVQVGHQVTIFTSEYINCRKKELMSNINIIRDGKQFFDVQWRGFCWYIFGKHAKFDLVIDQFHGIPFFTPLYIKEPKIAFIHEVTKEIWRFNPWPPPFNFIVSIIGIYLEPLVFKILYKKIPFLTVSKSTKKDLKEWGIPEKNITIIQNGITGFNIRRSSSKEKEKTAIFLGSLSKDKGIEDAIRIFYYINRIEENWQFWVVGKADPNYLQFLKKMSKDMKLRNIKFWGFVSEKNKYKLLARAHILVNPSIREGWGLVVIEAASVGTPTVGYNVPGLRDSIVNGKTGLLCEANPSDCSQRIIDLISNEKTYQRFRQNCFKWAKHFNWDKSTKKSLFYIERVSRQ